MTHEPPRTVTLLYEAAKPFARAYNNWKDPGTSDLDNEQPVSLTLPLGSWRKIAAAVAVAEQRVR